MTTNLTTIYSASAFLRIHEVIRLTGLSKTTLWRRMKEGTFPAAVKLGPRSTGWRALELAKWAENPASYRQS